MTYKQAAIEELDKLAAKYQDLDARAYVMAMRRGIEHVSAIAPEVEALGDEGGAEAIGRYWAHYLAAMLLAVTRNLGPEEMKAIAEAAAEFAASRADALAPDEDGELRA